MGLYRAPSDFKGSFKGSFQGSLKSFLFGPLFAFLEELPYKKELLGGGFLGFAERTTKLIRVLGFGVQGLGFRVEGSGIGVGILSAARWYSGEYMTLKYLDLAQPEAA